MYIKVVLFLPINMLPNRGMLTPLYTDYVTRPFFPPPPKNRSGNAKLSKCIYCQCDDDGYCYYM